MPRRVDPDNLIACCAVELDGSAPEWIPLMSGGPLNARDGRKWRLDNAPAVLARSREFAGDTDLLIDYEHQAEYSEANGQPAPAAGWIKELADRDGGIHARVEWTDRAREMIAAREYRYISPVFYHTPAGQVTLVEGASLTNKPALDLPALARRQRGADTMNETLIKLLKLLGFSSPKEEDLPPALAKVQDLVDAQTAATENHKAVAAAAGLDADAGHDKVLAKVKALAADPGGGNDDGVDPEKFVPMDQFKPVAKQLKTLQDDRTEEKAKTAVDDAIRAGKIAPAQRDWALAYAKQNLAEFGKYVEAAPVILPPGEIGRTDPPPGEVILTAEEKAVCKQSGLSEEKYLATKKSELEARAA